MNQYYFKTPFATSGDTTTIPRPLQPSGNVSFEEGFTSDYSIPNSPPNPNMKKVPRDGINTLFLYLTEAMKQYQEFGMPEWITAADNDAVAFSYSKGARVRYYTGSVWERYESLVDSNTATPGTDASKWRNLDLPEIPPYKYLDPPSGFVLSLSGSNLTIGVGSAADSTGVSTITRSSAITKAIATGWAAGDTNGGKPAAVTLTSGQFYRVFAIMHANGTVDAGIDNNASATNLLSDSGYTYFRRIGWVYYLSGAFVGFYMDPDEPEEVLWLVSANDLTTSAPASTGTPLVVSVPPETKARLTIYGDSGNNRYALVTSPNQTDSAATEGNASLSTHGGAAEKNRVELMVKTNSSRQIRYRSDNSTGWNSFQIISRGYRDNRVTP